MKSSSLAVCVPGLAAALCLALSACSRQPALPKGFVRYSPAGGGFSCAAPKDWRALENESGALVSFFGPPAGAHLNSADISIYHYSKTQFPNAGQYYRQETASASSASSLKDKKLGGADAQFFSMQTPHPAIGGGAPETITEEDYLIPAGDGFFALVYMASSDALPESEPVFQTLAGSFRQQ